MIDDAYIGIMCRSARESHQEPRRVIADYVHCSPQNIKAFEENRCHNSIILYAYLERYSGLREILFNEDRQI